VIEFLSMRIAADRAGFTVSALISIAILALFLSGCEPQGVTIMDRLSAFGANLNKSDRTGIQLNFSKGDTQDYASISSAAWWTANGFPVPTDDTHIYSIVVIDYVDPDNVTATMYGAPGFNGTNPPIASAVFVMVKDGADWFIRGVSLDGTVVIQ
jgi:hypothetical protein